MSHTKQISHEAVLGLCEMPCNLEQPSFSGEFPYWEGSFSRLSWTGQNGKSANNNELYFGS